MVVSSLETNDIFDPLLLAKLEIKFQNGVKKNTAGVKMNLFFFTSKLEKIWGKKE